jgi:opacity protein-like surface antigen
MRRFALLLMAGVLASEAAFAADIPESWVPQAPASTLTPPNWYLRGDLGYGWFRADRAISAPGFASPTANDFGSGFLGGAGLGYKSHWLRADTTIDYTSINYSGTIATPGDATAKVSALTALFNGYLDLGTWYGLTPYVGAGAGVSQIKTSDYTSTVAPPFASGLSNTQWKFAWALMSGAAINVTPNVAVDVGYRYLNLGDVGTASDAAGAMTLKNLAAHEVRVGIRWSFDNVLSPH